MASEQAEPNNIPPIGILGGGDIGQALARQFSRVKLRFTICNSRGPETLTDFVSSLGAEGTAGTIDQVLQMDIIVLAIRWRILASVLDQQKEWTRKIVIDATNPTIPSGVKAPEFMDANPSSVHVTSLVPGAALVKTFNTLSAELLGSEPRTPHGRRVMFVSGDEPSAKALIMRVVDLVGFAPVDVGNLSCGGRLQQYPGGPLSDLNLLKMT